MIHDETVWWLHIRCDVQKFNRNCHITAVETSLCAEWVIGSSSLEHQIIEINRL